MTGNREVLSTTQQVMSPDELGPSYDLTHAEAGVSKPNVLVAGAAAIVAAGGIWFGLSRDSGSEKSAQKAPETAQQAAERCDTLDFEPVASDSSKYHSEAFLPMAKSVDSSKETRDYINNLFGSGPLADKTDVTSLSAIMAVAVQPAHDGAAADPNYDYSAQWFKNMQRYTSNGGRTAAVQDCNQAYETLTQVAEYKDGWAKPGETITEFQAVRNDKNEIIGMKPVQPVTLQNLSGIELDLRKTTKGLDGFTPVLISTTENGGWDGRMFVKGITKGQGGEVNFDVNAINKANSQDNKGQSNNNNNGGGNQNGTNQGNQGTGGSAGPNGTNPEAGPGGVTDSPGEGGGTTTTTRGGGGTTTTTRPGTTTTTRPTTTTTRPGTTTTTTTTRPPVTTTTTVVKPPIECDPNVDVC